MCFLMCPIFKLHILKKFNISYISLLKGIICTTADRWKFWILEVEQPCISVFICYSLNMLGINHQVRGGHA